MAIFGGVTDLYKKSEAAVVVQNLLEHQSRAGMLDRHPGKFANALVRAAWQQLPDIFGGKFGQRPHKISTAATALALGAQAESDLVTRSVLLVSLGVILTEIEKNGSFYPFSRMDEQLFQDAVEVFAHLSDQLDDADNSATKCKSGVSMHTPDGGLAASLPSDQKLQMQRYGITFDKGQYVFQTYRYDRLEDAMNYAELMTRKQSEATNG
jgi:hypothetical protein